MYGSYTLPSSTNSDGVYTGPETYPEDVFFDGDVNSGTARNVSPVSDRVGMLVETENRFASMTAEMENKDTGETVSETLSHNSAVRKHLFDFEFSNGTGGNFAQSIYLDGEVPDTQSSSGETNPPRVNRIEIFASDTSKFSTIDSLDLEGNKLEIVQELAELGAYRFIVDDWASKSLVAFPKGTTNDEPFWTITAENRKLDYTDYANKVTVHGKTTGGTYNSATVSDSNEITVVGETRPYFEKNPDVETQSEVDDRAQRLLEEKVEERDESGSMEVVPKQIEPGYKYPVSPWSDAFRYGGRIGENALNFRPGKTDYVEFEHTPDPAAHSPEIYPFEILLHPRGLKEMGDDEYMELVYMERDELPDDNDMLVLYGDGSIGYGFGNASLSSYDHRTGPNVVKQEKTQRVSVTFGIGGLTDNKSRVYIDGQLEYTEGNQVVNAFNNDPMTWRIGADGSGNHAYNGGIDDVRIWLGKERSQSKIREFAYEDVVRAPGSIDNLLYCLRFDDVEAHPTTAEVVGDENFTPPDATIVGAEPEASFGSLEEVEYTLGDDGSASLKFDIAGRIDTELARLQKKSQSNRKNL